MVSGNVIPGRNRPVRKKSTLADVFIRNKLNHWLGILLVSGIAGVYGYLLARQTTLGFGILALAIGLFVFLVCVISTEAGLYINIVYAFFAFHISRMAGEIPVGILTDILILATFLGLFIGKGSLKQAFESFMKSPIVIGVLIIAAYFLLQMFNYNGHTFEGWFQGFRRFMDSVFVFFISYKVFDSYAKIISYLKVLFVLCVITGLYACIQQFHGLFSFELNWVMADELRFGLYFINGQFRKFSTMSDPTAFGVVMAACAGFFIIMALSQTIPKRKWVLIGGAIIMLLGMSYSGTRTANVMIVAAAFMFILLTFDKKATRAFAFVAGLLFLLLLKAPIYDNNTLNRFRSSFEASEDESFNVRERNRHFIQPYMYSHPIGYGLGTVGGGGIKYAPGHFLAGFPPDSAYLKKALEVGWIGLILTCILYFIIMKTGIREYFLSENEKYKTILAACVATLFSFYLAEFPQEAIGQITDIMVYYPIISIILRIRDWRMKSEEGELENGTVSTASNAE